MDRHGEAEASSRPPPAVSEAIETVIIGGGQAGLAVGYHLAKRGRPFVILDANQRIGDAWRHRWDSLRLFTPARYSSLPGMAFPASAWSYPTKDQVADYLEAYAARFQLPVRTITRVDRLAREGDRYLVVAGDRRWEADRVVVASGAYQRPHIPAFAADLDPSIVQLDAGRYRNRSQLADGGILVVGAGNTGAEIALGAAGDRRQVWLSGRDTGEESPFRVGSVADRLLTPPFWFVISRVLTVDTRIGRKLRHKGQAMGWPLVRVKPKDLTAAGIQRVPRTAGVRDGRPVLEDGRALEAANVVWCTGFASDFSWIDLPVLGDDGRPVHDRGVVASQPGLYFVGLFFLSALTSSLLGGVGADAQHIADHITTRQPSRPAAAPDRVGRRR